MGTDGRVRPRAAFFDAGGTLVHVDYARVGAAVRRVVGRAPTARALLEAEYAGRAAVEAAMATDGTGTDGSRWAVHFAAMLAALGFSADEIRVVSPAIRDEHARSNLWTLTDSGTAEGLATLRRRGLVVACISNADGTVDRVLDRAGLLAELAFVVDSGAVGVEKPDPRIFEIALERAGVAPSEALHVGDLYPVDVVGARRAGLVPVLVDPLCRYGDRDCRTTRDVPAFCRELVRALDAA